MTYVKINDQLYQAEIRGRMKDSDWDGRESKSITVAATFDEVAALFIDDLDWSIVYQADSYTDENGNVITPDPEVYDNSAYSVSGPITDNRDGSITIKMGKPTAEELLAILEGALRV